jgi:diguanylate cyclase (GGDEF)-like protein
MEAAPEASTQRLNPFRSEGLKLRALPFLFVALGAFVSLALPPGPSSVADSLISGALLVSAIGCFFLPWKVLPQWADVVVPLLYAGSALLLILAAGGTVSGVTLVVLLPIVWSALNLELWKTWVVLGASVIGQGVTTVTPVDVSDTIRLRKVVFAVAVYALIAYCIHELRTRIARVAIEQESLNQERARVLAALEGQTRRSSLLGELADMLNTCAERDEAYDVIGHSTQLMFPDGGSISILNPSKDRLETRCAWGDTAMQQHPFSPSDCWALRRGHVYESKPGQMICKHLQGNGAVHSLCRPLLAQGDLLGVLTVSVPESAKDALSATGVSDQFRQYALAVGEQISISMANFNLRETLRSLSIRDPLTNLFNRRFMEETLYRELSNAARRDEEVSILHMDIDHFKMFNDTYGHEIGDAVLRSVGDVLLSMFRDQDVPCRYGGEEFTVILPKCSMLDAERRARQLQDRVAELDIHVDGNQAMPTPPTLSIGIASSLEHGAAAAELLRAGDRALYAAKTAGRDRIVRAVSAVGMEEEMDLVTARMSLPGVDLAASGWRP